MKKFLKTFSKILIILSLIGCLCIPIYANKSHADAGYHTNYSGGSSSSSGSSSSYSSDRSSSSSSSSYSSGGSHSSSSGGVDDSILRIPIAIAIPIFVIIIVIMHNKSLEIIKSIGKPNKLYSNKFAIDMLKKILPDFNEEQFLQNGYKIFLDVEDAWMNFDLEKVRDVITDEMFNMYESQLSSMEIKGEQNIMEGFELKDCAISNCSQENDNIEVTTKYIIEFYDYIIEKSTGNVLRGSKSIKLRMHYDLTFIMSNKEVNIDKCPNCGAPLKINSAGVCDFCGSKIIGENTNWVMSKKVCTAQEDVF